ncbi:MAG: type protein [Candidatus Poribacteria bacterium]|nr:type protein [Candidatus Poribacteria bacterium]
MKRNKRYFTTLLIIISSCLYAIFSFFNIAEARLELSVIRPFDEFVTNNREIVIEGVVRYAEGQVVTVSITTPSGVPDLGAVNNTLRSITVDVGSSQSLTTIIINPVFKNGLSMAPRVVKLSFSDDGQTFQDKGTFNCTSGMGQDYGEARVDFNASITAKFVRIDMLDGWQSDKISIQEVDFLDASGKNIRSSVRSISIGFSVDDVYYDQSIPQAHFQTTLLLREGDNQISVSVKAEDTKTLPKSLEEDFVIINITYIPEVVVIDKPIVLSDGYKAELTIPSGALSKNLKKIGIIPMDVKDIEWTSYGNNPEMVKGVLPILAYKVEAGAETPFYATAKDSLERQQPNLVVDGNSEYPSTWMTALSALPVWLKVDLRSQHTIGKIIITSRVSGNVSYGPKKLSVLVSNDDISYDEISKVDECNDKITEIVIPTLPIARYVKFMIDEGKQGNNIQINELEFRDDEGTKIVAYTQLDSVVLARTAQLTLFYDDNDLISAGVKSEKNLAIFNWDEKAHEWKLVGGKVDTVKNFITVNLNYISTFAIFEAYPSTLEVKWSHNPFSPNDDGIADNTTIIINLGQETNVQAKVEIFDYTGKLIRTLIQEETQSGYISILWDGEDENGDRVEIGPYIYQVSVGKKIRNGAIIVAR